MEKAYGELDKDDAGFLTYDELADKLIALGTTLKKEDLVSLAADIDTDNDKKISKVHSPSSALFMAAHHLEAHSGNSRIILGTICFAQEGPWSSFHWRFWLAYQVL